MAQQSVDSKTEPGPGGSKTGLPSDKLLTATVKKTALRELPNDNKVTVSASIGSSSILKDKGCCTDSKRVSGTKRPSSEFPMNHHHPQSPGNNAGNGHLVYVRRKAETDLGKSSASGNPSINAYCPISSSRQPGEDEIARPKSEIKEPKVSCFPAFAPFPITPSVSSSGKPSVPFSIGNSAMRLATVESSFAAAGPTIGHTIGSKNAHWEERYHRLQMFLRKLDQSDQEEYIQMLQSISSIELSRHAVDLEKRSIQLSLEEAKELQRVAVLNILGKSLKNLKAPADNHNSAEKKAST
ncbi:uncharacterized protein LOC129303637 isoform X2 [Prosopis cineraria]|uniref:uncharacterized protein LOC129303637 isoform X2 n=1 Tax=Prosopis cineraria TaxID=364024 RepID=UPI00240EE7B2|nr:uncharacterized protein LOC129303637 isoform X2 [Prosopis cineraria]